MLAASANCAAASALAFARHPPRRSGRARRCAARAARRSPRRGCRRPATPGRSCSAGEPAAQRARRRRRAASRGAPVDRVRIDVACRSPARSSASLGSVSTSAAKAGSRSASRSRKAPQRRREARRRRSGAVVRARSTARPAGASRRVCAACQRLNGSRVVPQQRQEVVVATGRARPSPAPRSRATATAPAAPATSVKVMLSARPVEHEDARPPHALAGRGASRVPSARDEAERDRDRPSAPCRPGPASAASPARSRGGRSAPRRRSARSTPTRGVPACAYQRAKCDEVAAGHVGEGRRGNPRPSRPCRRSARSRGPCRAGSPRRRSSVFSMRTISAPFS